MIGEKEKEGPEAPGKPSSGGGEPQGGAPAEGSPVASPGDSLTLPRVEVDDLRKRAEERDLYRNELLRAKADLDNYQKRVRKERPQWEEQAARRFIRDLLPVCDNLERALEHASAGGASSVRIAEGVKLTQQLLVRVLESHGVEEIAADGEPFNPEVHDAVSQVVADGRPEGHVAQVFEKGYRHGDTVLRPSKVAVARGAKGREAEDGPEESRGKGES
ncbi:MAG: nucleotide exchange factor GrpE [Planctomycetes bacterium]|nr:nucleotide exchange factor GrpE [Planctomycetota bacterium]